VRGKCDLSPNIFGRLCQVACQAMVRREAELAEARKIGSVMGMMSGRVLFEDSSRLYRMTI
jgi:hypothetical protein